MGNNIKYVPGRVICRIDLEQKNFHTFANGQTIRIERKYDNFDLRYTEQVLGEVLSAEYIPKGAMILFHHNSLHAVNEILNHSDLSGSDIASGIKVFSIPEAECFLWKMPNEKEWMPMKNFAIAKRIFKPYEGLIEGISPTKIDNVLYIKTGKLKGKVVHTLIACDYEIIFRNESGIDEKIIRLRHSEDEDFEREEIIAISHELTEKVNNGELLVGINISDAKSLKQLVPNY